MHGQDRGWSGMLQMSSVLYLGSLLRSSSEIAQRWSSKIIRHISVGASRILLCIKNSPGRKRRNLKLIRVAQNKSYLACKQVHSNVLFENTYVQSLLQWSLKGCGLAAVQNILSSACSIPTLCTGAKKLYLLLKSSSG